MAIWWTLAQKVLYQKAMGKKKARLGISDVIGAAKGGEAGAAAGAAARGGKAVMSSEARLPSMAEWADENQITPNYGRRKP